jgi:biotin carboxyl carrier protein
LSFGQLVGLGGSVSGQTFMLSAGTFVIGRDAECELPLPNEPGVSRQHTKIVAEGDDYVLFDCESRNGTIVNGKPVARVRLKHGDVIVVSGAQFRFELSGVEQTQLFVPEQAPPPPSFSPSEPPRAPHAPAKPPDATAMVAQRSPALPPPVIAGGAAVLVCAVILVVVLVVTRDAPGQVADTRQVEAAPVKSEPVAAAPPARAPDPAAQQSPPKAEAPKEAPWMPVTPLEGSAPEPVRAKSSGKVATMAVDNGKRVEKGATLLVMEGDDAYRAQIATLKESISALQEIAKNNDRARKQLDQDKAELARLQSQKSRVEVVAPASGVVAELGLSVGTAVKAGQTIARIEQPARVKVATTKAVLIGATCSLQTPVGVKDGKVSSATEAQAILELPSGIAASDVSGARCD